MPVVQRETFSVLLHASERLTIFSHHISLCDFGFPVKNMFRINFSAIATCDVLTLKSSEKFGCSSLKLNLPAVKRTFLFIATLIDFDDVQWTEMQQLYYFPASFLMFAVMLNGHVETL